MRIKKDYMVLGFHNTSEAMAFEKHAMERGISGRLIPIPREITAGCGLAWRVPLEEYDAQKEKILELQNGFQSITALKL